MSSLTTIRFTLSAIHVRAQGDVKMKSAFAVRTTLSFYTIASGVHKVACAWENEVHEYSSQDQGDLWLLGFIALITSLNFTFFYTYIFQGNASAQVS